MTHNFSCECVAFELQLAALTASVFVHNLLPMTHLCQEVCLVIERYSETQKQAQKAVFTSTATLKGCNNVARRCGVSQQSHGTTSLNPKLICPLGLQQAGRKELPIVFCFCLQLHK